MYTKRGLTVDSAASYQIRIQGHLDESWSERMSGVTIRTQRSSDGSPMTILTGAFQDQAELAGVLNTLYDLGLPLLSVECLDIPANNPAGPPAPSAQIARFASA
jgi:hypothetical protein